MRAGVRLAQEIPSTEAFAPVAGEWLRPGAPLTDHDEVDAFVRARLGSLYHPVGTCKMGHDAMAVVDDTLKVHGMQGLRVVDASIMPTLVGGNTNAPTVMIAEKASEMIKQARRAPGRTHVAAPVDQTTRELQREVEELETV